MRKLIYERRSQARPGSNACLGTADLLAGTTVAQVDEAWRRGAAIAVAQAFALGDPTGALQPVHGGRSHLSWRLPTTTGAWAVKQLNRSRETWWADAYEIATEVERVAFRQGIAMPRPVPPVHPVAPLLADVPLGGEVVSVRVHEWCAGAQIAGDVQDAVLDWVGHTLAALHSLPVSLHAADAVRYEPHPVDEWRDWLAGAPAGTPADFLRTVRAFLPDIAAAKRLVDESRSQVELNAVFTHRDVKPDNVLVTSASPVLVDWDEAGIDFAEWEAVRSALAFSRVPGGWDRPRFRRVVLGYREAGGVRIVPVAASFAGVLAHQLGAAALLLWRALGHRPVSLAERAAAHDHALEFLTELRTSLAQLAGCPGWLDGLG